MTSIEGLSFVFSGDESRSETDLQALVATYAPLLFRVAYSVLRSRAEAEDTVQDAFVRVLEHRSTLPAIRDMRVWLVRIAWNLAMDRKRRIRPEQLDEEYVAGLAASGASAETALAEAQQMRSALRAIDTLPKAERQVLLLCALDDLETAEIACVLGKSESAIRSLLFRARGRLRARLDKGGVR